MVSIPRSTWIDGISRPDPCGMRQSRGRGLKDIDGRDVRVGATTRDDFDTLHRGGPFSNSRNQRGPGIPRNHPGNVPKRVVYDGERREGDRHHRRQTHTTRYEVGGIQHNPAHRYTPPHIRPHGGILPIGSGFPAVVRRAPRISTHD